MVMVLMYFIDVEEGGEMIFLDVEVGANSGGGDDAFSCAAGKLVVKLCKGDVLFFRSLYYNGMLDVMSLYVGCLVVKGVKFSVMKWMYVVSIEDSAIVSV